MNYQRKGFTLVELMIVIVVIAILATITIVSYRGVKDQAYNTATISAADTYSKLLTLHFDLHGPITLNENQINSGSFTGVCLGSVDSYPKVSGFAKGECWEDFWATPQLETALAKVGDADGNHYSFDSGSNRFSRGVQYAIYGDRGLLMYDLRGKNQDCAVRDSYVMGDPDNTKSTDCAIDMKTVLGENPIKFTP